MLALHGHCQLQLTSAIASISGHKVVLVAPSQEASALCKGNSTLFKQLLGSPW